MNGAAPFPLTRALGERIARTSRSPVPARLDDLARAAILDTLSVMLAGRSEPAVRLLRETRCALGEQPQAPSSAMAAVLATAAHVLDYDDVAFGGHPSAVIVPAVLVAAMLAERWDGAALLHAYVAGYETWAEIALREPQKYHARGLHPTGLLGPLAAAAATASVLGLAADQCSTALSLAASTSAGLLANFGSMAKPLHAGNACMAGMESAFLARAGYSAAGDALEADNGFLGAYSPSQRPDLHGPMQAFGGDGHDDWKLERHSPSVKRYPVCYAGHRCIDAALSLREAVLARGGTRTITRVVARLSQRNSDVLRFRRPNTLSEARFCLEYFIATALQAGKVSLAELSHDRIRLRDRQALMACVERQIETDMDPDIEGFARADRVEVHFADGGPPAAVKIARAKGHEDLPLTRQERNAKADESLASADIDAARRTWFIEQTWALGRSVSEVQPWIRWTATQTAMAAGPEPA